MLSKDEAIHTMNQWGKSRTPFLFIIDYSTDKTILFPLHEVPKSIQYSFNGIKDFQGKQNNSSFVFEKYPLSFEAYQESFNFIHQELQYGNSYLVNLTVPTRLETNLDLPSIFERSRAPYKLMVENQFVVFSPECFIKIREGVISSYPMKGTISAEEPDAEQVILNDPKEMAEHATIVDLIRNDLSIKANNVRVKSHRYIDRVDTYHGPLLQVSSEIEGDLPDDYYGSIGSILFSMLPAGSISGAPKKKTLEIIAKAEASDRGFFTGVFGVFDGKNLDSAVMIRFIEQTEEGLFFRSGGGITAQSTAKSEYEEMIRKVYVPFI